MIHINFAAFNFEINDNKLRFLTKKFFKNFLMASRLRFKPRPQNSLKSSEFFTFVTKPKRAKKQQLKN